MTRKVQTCTADATTDDLMRMMSDGRFRHVPVVDDDEHVCGIVSMTDLITRRVDELEAEKQQLEDLITSR